MSNLSVPVLAGKRVTLRPARPDDYEARLRLGTDAEIDRMYGGSRDNVRPMTEEAARRWVRGLRIYEIRSTMRRFALELPSM